MLGGTGYGGKRRSDFNDQILAKKFYYYNNKVGQIQGGIGYYKSLSKEFTWNVLQEQVLVVIASKKSPPSTTIPYRTPIMKERIRILC